MKVLIADDHAVVRYGLREILQEEFSECEISEARNGHEAIERIREGGLDIVLLDITMPGKNGLDVLSEMKRFRPKIPVLVLSMHPEDQYALRALKAGAVGYLTKETAPDELIKAIKTVFQGDKYISTSLAERLASLVQRGVSGPLHESLSDREYQVMRSIASGKTVSQIAKDLSLSVKTISTYRTRIMEKTGMKTNAELTRYALEMGLVD